MSEAEQEEKTIPDPIAGIGTMVFGKWDATDVVCEDPGLAPYINLQTIGTPHSGGRHANEYFGKANLSIIERFINNLMRSGKFSGKKQHCAKAFENALDTISEIALSKTICTKGGDGCDYNGVNYPVNPTEIKDSSGAGDTFIAALVCEFLKSNNIDKSINYANKCASKVVAERGVTTL